MEWINLKLSKFYSIMKDLFTKTTFDGDGSNPGYVNQIDSISLPKDLFNMCSPIQKRWIFVIKYIACKISYFIYEIML